MQLNADSIDALPGGPEAPLRRIAEIAGLDAALKIAAEMGGTAIYIAGMGELKRAQRDHTIRTDYDSGIPVRRLAAKFHLSDRAVRKILGRSP